jgi:hypothetical protein
MNNAVKGALLSGLVLPGLGQIVLRQYRRGIVIMLAVFTSLAVIVVDTVQQALDILEQIELQGDAIDMTAISNAAARESVQSGGVTINIFMLLLIVCWIAGTIDAYRIGKRKDMARGLQG